MRPKQNNYGFIDSQNLNLGVLALGWKLDFKKFIKSMVFTNPLKDKLRYEKTLSK
ncbi:MAG: hypothetical protein Q8N55_02925 [bacterium]|nr:hypothetical protein [bacterium]